MLSCRRIHFFAHDSSGHASSGNVLFMILIAIVLMSALTFAVTRSESGGSNLTREKASLAADQLSAFALDMKRAAENITRLGKSEASISFAHAELTGYGTPDTAPANEVFNIAGGGVGFVSPPANLNNGTQWEFSGFTAAPGVGDNDTADLMVVFPNVPEAFCRAYNRKAGYSETDAIPADTGACLYDTTKRFDGTFTTGSATNTMDAGTFRATPAPFACVACGTQYHAYYVLLER